MHYTDEFTMQPYYYAQTNHFHMGAILDKNTKNSHTKKYNDLLRLGLVQKHTVLFILAGHVIRNAYKQKLDLSRSVRVHTVYDRFI
jgi:hypothetical protein